MRSGAWSAVVLVLALPLPLHSTSLATCRSTDFDGLTDRWTARQYAPRGGPARWETSGYGRGGRPAEEAATEADDPDGLAGSTVQSVAFPTPDQGFVVGDDGAAFRTTDGGSRWTPLEVPDADDLWLVTCLDAEQCWVVEHVDEATRPRVFRTRDAGRTWTATRLPVTVSVRDLHFLTEELGWAVADDGALLETRDGGATWQRRALRLENAALRLDLVRFFDGSRGFVASGNRLFRTTNGGATWKAVLTLHERLSFFTIAEGPGELVAGIEGNCSDVTDTGNLRSTDDGASWTDVVTDAEREHDWDAIVQSEPGGPLDTVVGARSSLAPPAVGGSVSFAEAWRRGPSRTGRRSVVVERSDACSDVSLLAATEADEAVPLDEWVGTDLCALDPEAANAVLERFATRPGKETVVAFCATGARVFRVPDSVPRRKLARMSPRLLALARTAERLSAHGRLEGSGLQREAGARLLPLLRSGRYDAVLEHPAALAAALAEYEGPLLPKGTVPRVTFALPAGVSVGDAVPAEYPDLARQARVQGDVRLDVTVDPGTGTARDVAVVSGIPLLDVAAVHAVHTWRFANPSALAHPVRVVMSFVLDPCVRGGDRGF